jgi:hypothetical protein
MSLKKITTGMAAIALAVAPTAASAQAAYSADVRAAASLSDPNEMGGDTTTISIIGVVLLIALIIVALPGQDGIPPAPAPTSP